MVIGDLRLVYLILDWMEVTVIISKAIVLGIMCERAGEEVVRRVELRGSAKLLYFQFSVFDKIIEGFSFKALQIRSTTYVVAFHYNSSKTLIFN